MSNEPTVEHHDMGPGFTHVDGPECGCRPTTPPNLQEWQGRCGICGKTPCDYHGHYPVPESEI